MEKSHSTSKGFLKSRGEFFRVFFKDIYSSEINLQTGIKVMPIKNDTFLSPLIAKIPFFR